jgi:hypothetical protein
MKYGELEQRIRDVLFDELDDPDLVHRGSIYGAAGSLMDMLLRETSITIEWERPEPGVLHHTEMRMVDPRLVAERDGQ